LVNATPMGTKEKDPVPVDLNFLKGGTTVYDLVYTRETELVKGAKEKGLDAFNGIGMLLGQAALAFNIWTGKEVQEVRRIMEEAVREELKGK